MNVCNVTAVTLYTRATMPFVTVDPDRGGLPGSENVYDPGPPITRRWLYSTIQTSAQFKRHRRYAPNRPMGPLAKGKARSTYDRA